MKKNEYIKVLMCDFLFNLNFHTIIFTIFLKNNNLTIKEIGIIFSLFSFFKMFLEVPTGYLGDYYGRKKSVLLGLIITGGTYLLYLNSITFNLVILILFLEAIGYTLISGSIDAIYYDKIKNKNIEKYSSISRFTFYVSLGIGSLFGGYLYKDNYKLIFLFNFITKLGAFILLMSVQDLESQKIREKIITFKSTLKYVFNDVFIRYFLGVTFLIAISRIGVERYLPLYYFEIMGLSIVQISFFKTLALIVGALFGIFITPKLKNRVDENKIVLGGPLLLLIWSYLFAVTHGYFPIIFDILGTITFSLYAPFTYKIFQEKINSNYRASVLSFQGLSIGIAGIFSSYFISSLTKTLGFSNSMKLNILISIFMLIIHNLVHYRKIFKTNKISYS